MAITSLYLTNFRNITQAKLLPSLQGLNIIYGNNGSGKTSLLEAIHYLGLGKSFRQTNASRLIRHTTSQFSLFAQVIGQNREIPLGVERNLAGDVRIRMAEKDISALAELAYCLPLRLINSQSHLLFEGGPLFRRKFLDWGLFYHADNFLTCWRNFERVLKQRNAVLKDKRSKNELDGWTGEMLKYGLELDQMRQNYVHVLFPELSLAVQELLSLTKVEITYRSGWDINRSYEKVLAGSYQEELRLGYTQFGPHRADLDVEINGNSVRHFLSRGQQKLLICAMILAQGMLLAKYTNRSLIYLIDDLPSELDLQSRQRLISLLSKQKTQIFITALESDYDFINNKVNTPTKLFHVEHGSVNEIA